jgi:hypothetical protein
MATYTKAFEEITECSVKSTLLKHTKMVFAEYTFRSRRLKTNTTTQNYPKISGALHRSDECDALRSIFALLRILDWAPPRHQATRTWSCPHRICFF